ncbi:MAG: hypothetical protein IKL18_05610 [Oscillospiraceae bacterium]|nr:hypothetical protein [Oscillospiraceae bacterium]
MKKICIVLSLILIFCSCGKEPEREDLTYIAESGKYVDELGNKINFKEDIYSVNLNYAIGWDIKTLLPVKIYKGDKINGLMVNEIKSEYLFYNPLEVDIYGTVSEFSDENAPLFFHEQLIEFVSNNENKINVQGYFVFENESVVFYPKLSEENFYYLHNLQYSSDDDFDFMYNDEIKIQPIAIYCNTSDENGESGHRITKDDIEKKLNLKIEDDTKYVEAELSFQWLRFEINKSMQDENPMITMAYGYVEKIK